MNNKKIIIENYKKVKISNINELPDKFNFIFGNGFSMQIHNNPSRLAINYKKFSFIDVKKWLLEFDSETHLISDKLLTEQAKSWESILRSLIKETEYIFTQVNYWYKIEVSKQIPNYIFEEVVAKIELKLEGHLELSPGYFNKLKREIIDYDGAVELIISNGAESPFEHHPGKNFEIFLEIISFTIEYNMKKFPAGDRRSVMQFFLRFFMRKIWNEGEVLTLINVKKTSKKLNTRVKDVFTTNYDEYYKFIFNEVYHLHGNFREWLFFKNNFDKTPKHIKDTIVFISRKNFLLIDNVAPTALLESPSRKLNIISQAPKTTNISKSWKNFKEISGTIVIYGLELFTDKHILNIIQENSKIDKIFIIKHGKKSDLPFLASEISDNIYKIKKDIFIIDSESFAEYFGL